MAVPRGPGVSWGVWESGEAAVARSEMAALAGRAAGVSIDVVGVFVVKQRGPNGGAWTAGGNNPRCPTWVLWSPSGTIATHPVLALTIWSELCTQGHGTWLV